MLTFQANEGLGSAMGANDLLHNPLLPPGTPGELTDLEEIDRYQASVEAFAAGAIPDDRFTAIRLRFELDSDASDEELDALLETTERYCVVYQTLAGGVPLEISRS